MTSDFPPQPAPLRFLMSTRRILPEHFYSGDIRAFDADDVHPTDTPQTRTT
jgi:hypothetical protein